MCTHTRDDAPVPEQTQVAGRMAGVWRGLLVGLMPLGLLAAVVGMCVLLTALARQLFAGAGFFAQQEAAVIVLIVGLLLAIAVFAVAAWRVFRRVAAWQQSGARAQASATLWALSVTALLMVLPVVLALLLPQRPAP
jgi:ABC-type nickel/cobalt efflux system permease component RcnA